MKKMKRFICGLMAALMLFASVGVPVNANAATKYKYYIKINRSQNCVTIYKQDDKGAYTVPVKAMACSTGVNNATPLGKFPLGTKYRWHVLMGNVYGQYCSRIHDGVLFHSVYYSSADPSKLAYNSYNRLGQTASHGCVRLCVADAKWIYDNCASGTTVEIYDGKDPGPLGKPTPVKIDTSSKYRGWDPTDPDPKNPWLKVKPTITGAKNKTVERCAKKISLTKDITAKDSTGKTLKVKVTGTYKPKVSGKYKITYTATDARGLSTKKSIYITVADTKKPYAKAISTKLTIQETMEEADLIRMLKENVKATDSGEELSASRIIVSAPNLIAAMKSEKYGTYTVKYCAKDKAGNISAKHTFKVAYVNPNPEPEEPTDPENPANGEGNVTVDADPGQELVFITE